MTKAKELREQAVEELEAMVTNLRRELYALANEASQAQKFEKGHRLPQKKRELARVLTILKDKQQTV